MSGIGLFVSGGGSSALVFILLALFIIGILVVLLVTKGNDVPPQPTFPDGFVNTDKSSVIDQGAEGAGFYIQNQNGSFLNLKRISGGSTGPFQPYMFPTSAAGFTTTGSTATPSWTVASNDDIDGCPNSFLIGTSGGTCLSVSGATSGATVTCITCLSAAGVSGAHWGFQDQMDGQSSYSLRLVNCLGYALTASTNGSGFLIGGVPPTGTNTAYDFYMLQPSA